jgi:flagellar P-ring protein FlgI
MTSRRISSAVVALTAAAMLGLVQPAAALQVRDLARIKGAERSTLVGMGLVVGLKGTGDGKFLPAARPLAAVMQRLIDPNTVASELKDARNVALVALEATVPAHGVREGDRIDVHVSAIGTAKSLEGGRLFLFPLTGPLPDSPVFAFASGSVLVEDPNTPTVGVVKQGAQMVTDIRARFMNDAGQITLVLNDQDAGWSNAFIIADLINHEMSDGSGPASIAMAVDPKNIVVDVPAWERTNPAAFISRILQSHLDLSIISSGARVLINQRTHTIIVGADVEVKPTFISHPGLTITTITPQPPPTLVNPDIKASNFVGFDPQNLGGTRMRDLLAALEQLKVPARDRVTIIRELKASGALKAELILQ